ncbi:MAG: M23 family metallopeptidase [Terrimicrobiaceae bacterium]|nr:M23 family metallopeptidase [Terrimicrobiaceae bacterium]
MRRWIFWTVLFGFLVALVAAPTPTQTRTRVADGFDFPVGKPDAEGYYMSRGFLRYHPGEDWNGLGGGNTDIGAPVYSIGSGYVTFARDARMGWGNVVLVRHIFMDNGKLATVDSMYAHLDRIMVREGQQVARGQQVGTIGTNRGMYTAHLHFEVRKNLAIGINRSAFPRDFVNYYRPSAFITPRRKLPGGGRSALIPLNTYSLPQRLSQPLEDVDLSAKTNKKGNATPSPTPRSFRVNRFGDF